MPGGKTKVLKSASQKNTRPAKNKITKKENPIEELEKVVRRDDAHITSELHYFKGLSIMITVLIVVVFFTFGCLFASLYWEVKLMSQSFQKYIDDTHEFLTQEQDACPQVSMEPVTPPTTAIEPKD